jgi:hypothetical protein
MSPIVATLILAAIYIVWKSYLRYYQRRRQRILRERVAYMLWTAAARVR